MAADREKHSGLRRFAPRLPSASTPDKIQSHRSCKVVQQRACQRVDLLDEKPQMKDAIRANRFPKATFAQTVFQESARSDNRGDESRRQTLPIRQTAVGYFRDDSCAFTRVSGLPQSGDAECENKC